MGCAMVGSDTPTVSEFITHGRTGLLTPFHDPRALADSVLRMLEDTKLARRLRANGRKWAESNLAMQPYLTAFERLIRQTIKQTGRHAR